MEDANRQIEEQALGWVIRLRDARADDWAEFTQWLEASPEHSAAYDRIALLDEDLGALPRTKTRPIIESAPASAPAPLQPRRRAFAGWGVAAAALLTVGLVTMQSADSTYEVATAAGERRTVQLADGSRIDLNGSTTITLDRDQPRFASLERGEALFTVVHKASNPFEVRAGDDLIYDVGTVFNVVSLDRKLRVAVSEGAVIVNPRKEAVNLTPGMAMEKDGPRISVRKGEPEAAGAWKDGRLVYAGAQVTDVAADLSRNLGVPVRVDGSVAGRSFSGVLSLDGQPENVLSRAAALLGARAKRLKEGWILTSE